MKSPVPPDTAPVIAAGLLGLMDVEQGPTDEQWQVFRTFAGHLLQVDASRITIEEALSPSALAHRPLVEIREEYHVVPLRRSMRPGEDPALWPA